MNTPAQKNENENALEGDAPPKPTKTKIHWVEEKQLVARGGSGHSVVVDGSPAIGGNDAGMRPMELMLSGVATCTAMDVLYILGDRMHQRLTAMSLTAEAQRAPSPPKVFTAVHFAYVLAGRELDPKKVERAIRLSLSTYCSGSAMLHGVAQITASFEIPAHGTGEGGDPIRQDVPLDLGPPKA